MNSIHRKLIEVALPLEEINKQSAREKSIRHGHPSTLHLWWARRPLAACRAVLFSSLVDDPSEYMPDEESANDERQRLFRLIEQLVNWDNVNDEKLLGQARLEIARSVARNLGVDVPIGEAAIREFLATKAPPVLDPFCGGGSIPLEAQRLGLRAFGSDLNPVAVLITKALIEIPPKFAGWPPVHPVEEGNEGKKGKGAQMPLPASSDEWKGAAGLAEDVRYYGRWMRDEAERRIGHLYPKVKLPKKHGGGEATVIAWLWARTVKCPNPACGATMPLVRSFWLSTKKGKQAWVQPVVDQKTRTVLFEVEGGNGIAPEGTTNRRGVTCVVCQTPAALDDIRNEAKAGRMNTQLLAIVAESNGGRIYRSPDANHSQIAQEAVPTWSPDQELQGKLRVSTPLYGMSTFASLFTKRQLVALNTYSDLVDEARKCLIEDAIAAGLRDDSIPLTEGGTGATAYADAVATYLGLGASKVSDYNSTLVVWSQTRDQAKGTFARQALPMVWDFAEVNPFAGAAGDISVTLQGISEALGRTLPTVAGGVVEQRDATEAPSPSEALISTDPPYYDNISYADLSDFFYVWLRRTLVGIYPRVFGTMLVPKTQELVATPYRFGGDKAKAEEFFEKGLGRAFGRMRQTQHSDYPLTVYYAFKQAESEEDFEGSEGAGIASTGWDTMLEGLLNADFSITGTWPMRTERSVRSVGLGTNALASSIILVCRLRAADAPIATRREFVAALKRDMPPALKQLQKSAIAPVDLAQAVIGPGMAVFSRFRQVLEADGAPMRVRTALVVINQTLDEYFAEQEGEFDSDTRWALAWFEQFAHGAGPFGDAETLSKAKNTSVDGLVRAGVLEARAGKVRLLRRDEVDVEWTPESDERQTVWESAQHLIRALDQGGEQAASELLRRLGNTGQAVRDLAYRLYAICERKGWAQDALAYNMLAAAWPRLVELAGQIKTEQSSFL